MTNDRIPLAGVIGYPVAHSKSPRLHGYWLKTLGISGHYIPLEVAPENLNEAIRTLYKLGFVGANVTIPHKEAVMEIADMVTDRATLIGAANTLTFREDGGIHADNTDGYGFIENLRQGAPDWDPKTGPAVVLGAGGAARAVVVSLLDAGVPEIVISNRTRIRAEELQRNFGKRLRVVDWVHAGGILQDAHITVNTTSLGMIGKPELQLPLNGLRAGTIATDLVYTPLRTHFLNMAADRGCTIVDGLGMLLHQAVPGFDRWFGQRPLVDDNTRAAVLE